MCYVNPNFKTKKALKAAVAGGERVVAYSNGDFPPPMDGVDWAEGPHYPAPHTWYAEVTISDGLVVAVK